MAWPRYCSHRRPTIPPPGIGEAADGGTGAWLRYPERMVHRSLCSGRQQDRRGALPGIGVCQAPSIFPPSFNWAELNQINRYSVFRRVVDYYSDDPTGQKAGEDAFDMRKPLKRDKKRQHVRENGEKYKINPTDLYHH